jgi:dTDP-4-dehydrorhamnose 3,5-epimerase
MIFTETKLSGAFIITIQRIEDQRGFFARTFCQSEFREHGLNPNLVQCNISYNRKVGTLRGMHFQVNPHWEAKLVQCVRGSIFDVIIDLRPESPTYTEHIGVTLTAQDHNMLFVPERFAHGFITLEDDTDVFYQMSEFYTPASARGFRWNDSVFEIKWPLQPSILSERDASYPEFSPDLLK